MNIKERAGIVAQLAAAGITTVDSINGVAVLQESQYAAFRAVMSEFPANWDYIDLEGAQITLALYDWEDDYTSPSHLEEDQEAAYMSYSAMCGFDEI
jgi:hypothetical protein